MSTTLPRRVEDDRTLLEHLDFDATPLCCELLGHHDVTPTVWVICRSCDRHQPSCDQHLTDLRDFMADATGISCTQCGRRFANFDQAIRVEPLGAV